MNRLMLFLVASMTVITLFSCSKDDAADVLNCAIEGRWVVEIQGQANTLYEFYEGQRYTIYASDQGTFGSRADALPGKHDYEYRNDSLVIDLNFGNYSVTMPTYSCDCNRVALVSDNGTSEFYKEGFDSATCD